MSPLVQVFSAIAAVLVWVVAWYFGTAQEVSSIWWRSDTFAHGLLVLPISGWLAWRNRDRLAGLSVQPALIMALPILAAGFGWLLGELASVASVTHAALAFVLVFSLIGVLGFRLARPLAFPILFLLFGVPIGEFLLPVMMDYTAEFTVAAVRLSGVPVYQEGLHFVIPNGRWSVVEACSGVRYLIASLMVGTLYAYLSYRSLSRRLLFVAAAIIVPIIANWLRAYMIVMLGYLSDNRIATGVDHLLYGWLFFGIVIILMFWIGGRWREDLDPVEASRPLSMAGSEPRAGFVRVLPLALAIVLAPLALRYVEHFELLHPETASPIPPLVVAAPWTETSAPSASFKPSFMGYREDSLRHYTDGTHVVSVYIASYANQQPGHELVQSQNALLLPNDSHWNRLNEAQGPDSGAGRWLATRMSGESVKALVWSGYWINGRLVTSDYLAKGLLVLGRLQGHPDTSVYGAVWASAEDDVKAGAALQAFHQANGRALLDQITAVARPLQQ
ncbi:exosortase A [Zoogloea sp.]|uniref:exosortase A n=1 Tax=Zoogloea sp. TaxID=49181 RepID=UPI0025E49D33|nr:exosortase A [Zoogloea sp.]MCK6394165.1 exosortase A [Zoogloea sp.]